MSVNKQFYHDQLQSLTKRLQQTIAERDMAAQKFQESEALWNAKSEKIQAEHKMMLEMSTEIKDDNKQLMMEIDKYLKRIR